MFFFRNITLDILVTVSVIQATIIHCHANAEQAEQDSSSYTEKVKGVYSQVREYLNFGLDGLVKLAEALHTVDQFIDSTIDEDCELAKCPAGTLLKSRPSHVARSNGCGSFGYEWKEEHLPTALQKDCCNEHDICYDTCGADKDECDLKFKKCLYGICKDTKSEFSEMGLKACKAAAKLMYTGTLALGCQAYRIAQQEACHCVRDSSKEEL